MQSIARLAAALATVCLAGPAFANTFADADYAYLHGNYRTAIHLYKKAAAEGDTKAYKSLGWMYQYGNGVPVNLTIAEQYYTRGAKAGDAGCEEAIGEIYYYGEGVPKDLNKALAFFKQAAALGDAEANAHLSDMFQDGEGVTKDDSEAETFRLRADPGVPALGSPRLPDESARSPDKLANATIKNSRDYSIKLTQQAGGFVVPASIDGVKLDFLVDSGAADVSIPSNIVDRLRLSGEIKPTNFIGIQLLVTADGRPLVSPTFTINSMTVGSLTAVDVPAIIIPASSRPLLGQSFLKKFRSWSIDNDRGILTISK